MSELDLFMEKGGQESELKESPSAEREASKMLGLKRPGLCQKCGRQATTEYDSGCRDDSVRDLCQDCLKERYKDIGPGFRNLNDEEVEIFSHTTGWERIKFKWVKKFFNPAIVGNSMFPVNVYLQHEEMVERKNSGRRYRLDNHTYGITWAAARFLSVRTGIAIPEASD